MMLKRVTLVLIISLLLSVSLTEAIRPQPTTELNKSSPEGFKKELEGYGEECNEVEEQECMWRRTLVAHTDYIYTQGKHN
ncbi:phytosulfokines-like protein [Carex littledalei]|uniref:Phytosulfokine n=1 Tax=Carex littledalei TaxID=544730 RepID=A0A833VIH2_9POAL|nr:phytosulfokines-like protein [Carex littledalei]